MVSSDGVTLYCSRGAIQPRHVRAPPAPPPPVCVVGDYDPRAERPQLSPAERHARTAIEPAGPRRTIR
jgi:hypothetical protein